MKLSDFLKGIGRPVAYFPKLAVVLGGVKEAVFLAQIIYWSDKGDSGDGWIYKTQEELCGETGLSRYEQEGARKTLRGLGILEERYARLEHRLYYRINFSALDSVWATFPNGGNQHSGKGKTSIREEGKPAFVPYTEITTETTDILPFPKNHSAVCNPVGATPQTPPPQDSASPPLAEKLVEEVDKCMACTPIVCPAAGLFGEVETAESIVKVWSARLSMIPRMRGPGMAKRRQWIGELERWVKEDGGLTYQDVVEVLIFAMESDFWRTRIISPKALRKHWDTLVSQRLSSGASQDVEGALVEFAQVYERTRGKGYIRDGKDKFRAKDLLGQVGREELGGLIKEFFEREDDFLDKQGRTFSCFVGQINRLRRKEETGEVNKKLQANLKIIRESRGQNGHGKGDVQGGGGGAGPIGRGHAGQQHDTADSRFTF